VYYPTLLRSSICTHRCTYQRPLSRCSHYGISCFRRSSLPLFFRYANFLILRLYPRGSACVLHVVIVHACAVICTWHSFSRIRDATKISVLLRVGKRKCGIKAELQLITCFPRRILHCSLLKNFEC
jgi:hypothetical protein